MPNTNTVESSMEQLRITVDEIMDRGPCYTREQVEALANGRQSMTVLEVLELDIPAQDRLWVCLHESLVSPTVLHTFACDVAEEALLSERSLGREPDPHSWTAVEMKRRWIRGDATDAELDKARLAAIYAASDAATRAATRAASAAYVATYTSATYAAADAAHLATIYAATDATTAAHFAISVTATYAATRAAAYAVQVDRLRRMLKGE